MTLILKTNTVVRNAVGNVHGNTGPSDFVAMLDFGRDEYFTMLGGVRKDYGIDDVISVSRTSYAPYMSPDGIMRSAAPNKPRRHFLPGFDTAGLAVLRGRQNYLTGASANTVTVPAASEAVILSYSGGLVSLDSASLTLAETVEKHGRTVKRYTRTSGAITSDITISGGAKDIQVELATDGAFASPFMGYATTVASETASLKSPFKGLLSSGTGTIVTRNIMLRDVDTTSRPTTAMIAVQSEVPLGGAFLSSSRTTSGSGTDNLRSLPDGSTTSTTPTTRASANGNWKDSSVTVLGMEGHGDKLRMGTYGQYAEASDLGVLFSDPTEVFLGGTSYFGTNGRLGGIITHVIIYDRLLRQDEILLMANQWM